MVHILLSCVPCLPLLPSCLLPSCLLPSCLLPSCFLPFCFTISNPKISFHCNYQNSNFLTIVQNWFKKGKPLSLYHKKPKFKSKTDKFLKGYTISLDLSLKWF
uniref:Secreted protein n=1 Tax=Cacopsylla melanoneura TaxID=428564 RepID=A0A8D8Z441_9HEMI